MKDIVDYVVFTIIAVLGILAIGLAVHEQYTGINSSKLQYKLILATGGITFIGSVLRNII